MVLDNAKENSIPTRGDLWDTGACVRLRYELDADFGAPSVLFSAPRSSRSLTPRLPRPCHDAWRKARKSALRTVAYAAPDR